MITVNKPISSFYYDNLKDQGVKHCCPTYLGWSTDPKTLKFAIESLKQNLEPHPPCSPSPSHAPARNKPACPSAKASSQRPSVPPSHRPLPHRLPDSLSTTLDSILYLRTHLPPSFVSNTIPFSSLFANTSKPQSLTSLVPTSAFPAWASTSHALLVLGLLTSVPAILTGGAQAVKLFSRASSWYTTDTNPTTGETRTGGLLPKFKVTVLHALANDAGLVVAGVNWYYRRGLGDSLDGEGKHAVDGALVALGAVTFGLLTFAGNLGAVLTYNYGVGLNVGGGKGKGKRRVE